jgi:WD40 repeat protein
MMQEQAQKSIEVLPEWISRRTVIKGLAGLTLALTGYACAPTSPPSAPAPTATPRPVGSTIYTYQGHTDRVTSVAWSPDGRHIVSGSVDKTVQVWSAVQGTRAAATSSQAYIYQGHSAPVYAVAWSPDSNRIASGSDDKTAQVWDAATGSQVSIYRGHTGTVTTITFSPDGRQVASGSSDKTIQVWEAATGTISYTYRGHSDGITTLGWSPDGKYIASGSLDKTVQVWEAATGIMSYTYRGHSARVTSLSWSPDGKYIASASYDRSAQVWSIITGNVLYNYRGYNVAAAKLNPTKGVLPDIVSVVAWSPNGKRIAAVTQEYCGDECGVVVFWDATTGRNVSFYSDLPIFALAWSPDTTRIVTALGYTSVKISQAS